MITAYRHTAESVREQIRRAELDHHALSQPIKACEISRCRATCCHDGVYLSAEEKHGIEQLLTTERQSLLHYGLQLPEKVIIPSRGGTAWKTATREAREQELAEDYPSHFPKTRCVFLDDQGYCGIQRWSMEQQRGDWFDKPLTCWIHPLLIQQRAQRPPLLTLVSPENDPQRTEEYPGFASCTHCGRPDEGGQPAYLALQPELEALSILAGRDLLAELMPNDQ